MKISSGYPINGEIVIKAMPYIKAENKTLYVAMLFSFFVGLRAKEIFSLSWNDVNIERKSVTYTHKEKDTIIKIIPESILREFVSFKGEEEHEDTDPIFTTINKSRLTNGWTKKQLYNILEKYKLNYFHFNDLYKLNKELLFRESAFNIPLLIKPSVYPTDLTSKYIDFSDKNQRKINEEIIDFFYQKIQFDNVHLDYTN
ncbi:tyrosine-type recombinase/integrase [Paenibacillus macquariensis]|uniref:Phage integrase family protein n=1 Tax=Paenibacillus macquariensis TaxID=948756 RepID=A0ABY1KE83_9BACL|nr:tyrosine-type recombinase/integrase [Paenibacillus macquariensis]MEC0093417.1 tyrosine-type recombinase/integrase [Paenibacillus macquariensis]OAB38911.1 hypothetical protein PMSM_01095 [Paenibacillus macquariensis subsp. macquariensis]SIR69945.1 Phage integrase family protein [Paenibacillus macquariensis]